MKNYIKLQIQEANNLLILNNSKNLYCCLISYLVSFLWNTGVVSLKSMAGANNFRKI